VLSWFILVPLAGLILLNLPLGEGLGKRAFAVVLALSLAQIAAVLAVPPDTWAQPGPLVSFLDLHLRAGSLGLVMLLCIGLAVAAAAMVGSATVADRRPRFVSVLLISLMGMNGAVLVTDLFSLYVFLEVTALSSFVLIAFNRDSRGLEGAFKYLILGAVASILIVTSVAVLLLVTGGTSFTDVAEALRASTNADAVIVRIALGGVICGLLIKGGLIPFHGWVVGAYSAGPSATSVLLAGIATKVSGIYALIRLVSTILPAIAPVQEVLMAVGAVSIVVGALAAMGQTDLKRLLAYSSISQVGYIILGLGCPLPPGFQGAVSLGVVGAVFHLFNHCIAKSLLFVNSAALEQRLGTTDMNSMGGLGSRMPVTSVTSVIGALSTAGIPPLSGFWSKAIIVLALWQAHRYVYAGLAVLLSVATLAYMLLLQRKVFFGKLRQELASVREASWQLVVSAVALALITTAAGLLFPLLWGSFLVPAHGGL
jgi:proton-translocating NADH-quinone oxidoreductase chain N